MSSSFFFFFNKTYEYCNCYENKNPQETHNLSKFPVNKHTTQLIYPRKEKVFKTKICFNLILTNILNRIKGVDFCKHFINWADLLLIHVMYWDCFFPIFFFYSSFHSFYCHLRVLHFSNFSLEFFFVKKKIQFNQSLVFSISKRDLNLHIETLYFSICFMSVCVFVLYLLYAKRFILFLVSQVLFDIFVDINLDLFFLNSRSFANIHAKRYYRLTSVCVVVVVNFLN